MENLNQILHNINNVIIIIFSIGFMMQFVYILLFFLPARKYKKSSTYGRVGIIISAKNEEKVIGDLITSLKHLNYPQTHYDIFVIADNCTDQTAAIARKLGATVFERKDDNKAHHRLGYALAFGFDHILKLDRTYDFYVKFDADNIVDKDYLEHMNNAFYSGAKLAKGYNNAKNLDSSIFATISGLWYIRDNRFTCQARSALGLSQILTGPGMMISHEIIEKNGGWIHLGISEDVDFALDELIQGTNAHYVSNAIFYDDQPLTLKDTFRRMMRMGRGLIKTFFTYGIKCLFMFFKTLKFKYLDMFLTQMFIPMALVAVVWFPLFYGYDIIYQFSIDYQAGVQVIETLEIILIFAFIIPFILQAMLVYLLERKRIIAKRSNVWLGIFTFPLFMIIYALGISLGILFKPQWKAIKRSDVSYNDLLSK